MTKVYLDNIYYHCTDLTSAFGGKKIFIAGNGFYAKWFKSYFEYLKTEKGIPLEWSSLSKRDGWYIEHCESYSDSNLKADFVINCAGSASGGDNHDMLWTHGIGPINLFSQMKLGAKGLQISTGAIDSDTPYARAKKVAEIGIGLLNRDIQIVRPFATVGPGMNINAHFAVSTFIRRALSGLPLEVTDKPCYRSFVHIVDLMVQMLHVMVNGDGKPYNVGSDNLLTMREAAEAISDNINVVSTDFPTNSAAEFYSPDLSRVLNQFNLELDFSSEDAITDTMRWYESHV